MSNPDLDPHLLRAFLAVADHLSFTKAAIALNRTQSAISAQIRKLEDQLGVRLFLRSTTRVALSPAAESLAGYARRILLLHEEAVMRLRRHEVTGRVRLGVMQDYGELVLPPILKTFWNLFPGIEIQLETGLTSGMTGRLGGHFDIVIAMHKAGEGDGALLRREDTVWAGTASIDLGQLDPLPVALYPEGCLFRKWALDALDRAGRGWRLAFVSHSMAAVEAIATQGLAITVLRSGAIPRSLVPLGRQTGLPPLPRADIRLHRFSMLSEAGTLLADHLCENLSGASGSLPLSS
jgi:DNA-binding transcriptional LysR family regulator